jgi:hypothetical protein
MPRGGHRENAGRKRGTPNKATAVRQAEVAASGITPLEVMLDNMRFAHQRAGELLAAVMAEVEAGEVKEHAALIEAFKPILALRQTAQNCARDAANYVHPKLANIQHGSDADNPMNTITDDDRAQVIVAVLAENPKMLDHVLKQLT